MIESLPIESIDSRIAPIVALAAVVVALAVYGTRRRLGPHADWVEVVRSITLPVLDPIVERYAGGVGTAYELDEAEYAGHIPASPETVERRLWDAGCRRNPVAALKTTDDGRTEVGSWVYRGDSVGRGRQVHVMLFATPDGGTDVYAHEEYSSALSLLVSQPDVLRKHYQGVNYDPEAGIEWVRGRLRPLVGLLDGDVEDV